MSDLTVVSVFTNAELEWSKGKRAAHAAHATLHALGESYTHPIIVLNANRGELAQYPMVYRDADGHAWSAAEWGESEDGERRLVLHVLFRKKKYNEPPVLAAMMAARVYGHEAHVLVTDAAPADILHLPSVIHDQGRTELEPGTLTAGARVMSR